MSTLTPIKTKTDSIWEWQVILGTGIFATGLAQPEVMTLPFRRLLADELHVDRQQMALFFFVASIPWSLKLLSGLLLDSVPLFGTRRRNYMLLSAIGASLLWLLLGFLHHSFVFLVSGCFAINVLLVMASSAGGALFAEGGQRLNAIDRFATVRVLVDSTNTVIAGPLSGWLAHFSFMTFAFVGALIPLSLAPPVLLLLREPPTAKYQSSAFQDAWSALRTVVSSKKVWTVALFLCLVSAPQSFQTSLYFHQREELNFTPLTIGMLESISGGGGILATGIYALLRRYQRLRVWLILGILCGTVDAYIYTFYRSIDAAYIISLAHGVLVTLSVLAMLEVAGLATPMGATALGFAVIASAWNTGLPLGDYGAATLHKMGFSFYEIVSIYTMIAPLTLVALFLLPQSIQKTA